MMFSPLPADRMSEGLYASWGLGESLFLAPYSPIVVNGELVGFIVDGTHVALTATGDLALTPVAGAYLLAAAEGGMMTLTATGRTLITAVTGHTAGSDVDGAHLTHSAGGQLTRQTVTGRQ